jgi:hypothetical protein
MLVLAMKFSRCARAATGPKVTKAGCVLERQAKALPPLVGTRARAPEVAPSKRNRRIRSTA